MIPIMVSAWRSEQSKRRTSDIAEADLPRSPYASAMMTSEVHVEPTDSDRHCPVRSHGHEEQRRILQRRVIVYGDQDTKACDSNTDAKDSEAEAMLELVGQVCDDHGEPECCCPRWYAVQLRLDGGVSVSLDDARCEICIGVGWNDE